MVLERASKPLQGSARFCEGSARVLYVSQGSKGSVLQGTVRFFDAHKHAVGFSKMIRDLERLFQVLQNSEVAQKVFKAEKVFFKDVLEGPEMFRNILKSSGKLKEFVSTSTRV